MFFPRLYKHYEREFEEYQNAFLRTQCPDAEVLRVKVYLYTKFQG